MWWNMGASSGLLFVCMCAEARSSCSWRASGLHHHLQIMLLQTLLLQVVTKALCRGRV